MNLNLTLTLNLTSRVLILYLFNFPARIIHTRLQAVDRIYISLQIIYTLVEKCIDGALKSLNEVYIYIYTHTHDADALRHN